MFKCGFEDRSGMIFCQQTSRGGQRSGKVRLRFNHHTLRMQGAGNLANSVAASKAHFRALIILRDFRLVDRQPQLLRALLEGSDAGLGEAVATMWRCFVHDVQLRDSCDKYGRACFRIAVNHLNDARKLVGERSACSFNGGRSEKAFG